MHNNNNNNNNKAVHTEVAANRPDIIIKTKKRKHAH